MYCHLAVVICGFASKSQIFRKTILAPVNCMAGKIVSEMICNLSNEALDTAIPYYSVSVSAPGWLCGTVVERRFSTVKISPSCARPAADGDHLCG